MQNLEISTESTQFTTEAITLPAKRGITGL